MKSTLSARPTHLKFFVLVIWVIMDSSMERSFDSNMEKHREEDRGRHYSAEPHRSAGRHRSMSDPDPPRQILVQLPGNLKRDSMGVVWRKHAVVDEYMLPKNPAKRNYIANRLTDLGYGEREICEDVQVFVLSLKRLVRARELDFILDSSVWNFILASWVKGSDIGGKFDFGISVDGHNCLIKRRAELLKKAGVNKEVDDYGRALFHR